MRNFLQQYLAIPISTPADVMKWLEASYIQLSLNGLSTRPEPFYPIPGNFKIYMPEQVLIQLLQDESANGAYVAPDRLEQYPITNPVDGEIYLLWTTVHFTPDSKVILAANHANQPGHPFYFEALLNEIGN